MGLSTEPCWASSINVHLQPRHPSSGDYLVSCTGKTPEQDLSLLINLTLLSLSYCFPISLHEKVQVPQPGPKTLLSSGLATLHSSLLALGHTPPYVPGGSSYLTNLLAFFPASTHPIELCTPPTINPQGPPNAELDPSHSPNTLSKHTGISETGAEGSSENKGPGSR